MDNSSSFVAAHTTILCSSLVLLCFMQYLYTYWHYCYVRFADESLIAMGISIYLFYHLYVLDINTVVCMYMYMHTHAYASLKRWLLQNNCRIYRSFVSSSQAVAGVVGTRTGSQTNSMF